MGILSRLFGLRAKYRPGVYTITNRHTGCVYIGATTKTIAERWDKHRRDLTAGRHHNKRLQRDWNTYSWRAFKFSILEMCDAERVFEREKVWQRKRHTPDGCYNPHPDVLARLVSVLQVRGVTLERLRELRSAGYSRDRARELLRAEGVSFDNAAWSKAR